MLGKPAEKLDTEEQQLVEQLCQAADWVPQTYALAQGFQKMVRERQADQLDTWLGQAKSSSATGLRNFALGLQKDQEAIQMAISHPQSNGQTEGQVNRLKMSEANDVWTSQSGFTSQARSLARQIG